MATTYYYPNQTWRGWISTPTSTTTTVWYDNQLAVWNGWTTGTGTGLNYPASTTATTFYAPVQQHVYAQWQVAHEQMIEDGDARQARLEAESRRRLELQQAREKAAEERLVAHARGLELLDMLLTPEQREQRREGKITVRGSEGGLFCLDVTYSGVHGNVTEIDEHGCFLGRICVAPQMSVDGRALPLSDGWVGQLLAIQADEAHFRAVGNWSSRMECQRRDVPILRPALAA